MTTEDNIKKYDLTRGEKVSHGPMAGLEIVFRKLAFELESFLFEQFEIPFEIDYHVEQGVKFRDFQHLLNHPVPIFTFDFFPYKGKSLLVTDNRFANLFFAREDLLRRKKMAISNKFQVSIKNYRILQKGITTILEKLQQSWSIFEEVRLETDKLVSHRLKANVMNPSQTCIVTTLRFRWHHFESNMKFCFSYALLDPIMRKISRKDILVSEGKSERFPEVEQHFKESLKKIPCEISGVLGKVRLSKHEILNKIKSGEVIPVSLLKEGNSYLTVNDVPVFTGTPGVVNENFSMQLNGNFEIQEDKMRQGKEKTFGKLRFKPLT